MSDEQTKSDAPEPRKIAPGDKVQVKGGMGPKMIVNERHSEAEIVCVYFDEGVQRFVDKAFHSDALAYFDSPTPAGRNAPVAYGRSLLERQIGNALVVLDRAQGNPDVDAVRACITMLNDELAQHVEIARISI